MAMKLGQSIQLAGKVVEVVDLGGGISNVCIERGGQRTWLTSNQVGALKVTATKAVETEDDNGDK